MNFEAEVSDAKQRVLDVAERLFMQHGYAAITLRDIAEALGIRQASLYYHFPAGKEQLFVAVATRVFERHHTGMVAAIAGAGETLAAQLYALADWFGGQPPLNLLGMTHADIPALSEAEAKSLAQLAYQALFTPLRAMFLAAQARGEIRALPGDLLSGAFLALMDGVNVAHTQSALRSRQELVDDIISLMLDGLHPRSPVEGRSTP